MSVDDEFGEYVAARWPRLVRSAVLLGCSPDEAQDVVQAALVRCLIHWSKVAGADDRDAYVHRVLVNTFTSTRRRRWRGEVPASTLLDSPGRVQHLERDQTDGRDQTVAVDTADAVLRSLSRLTDEHRTAVVLRYYAHLNEEQMATALGVARGTVKSRLSRALKVLAEDSSLAELRGTP